MPIVPFESSKPSFKTSQIVNGEKVEIDYSDFRDLRNNRNYDEFKIGQIKIISGQIVITDPFLLYNPRPLNKRVEIGYYEVYLYFIKCIMGYRVAYAMIEFEIQSPSTWECALTNENLLEDFEKTTNGLFPVDAGLLSISDHESFKKYDSFFDKFVTEKPEGNLYDDLFAFEFAKNGNNPTGSYEGGDWINYSIDNVHNIVMFSSGLGDGLYPAYWGIDKSGKPLKLLIDLLVNEKLKNKKQ